MRRVKTIGILFMAFVMIIGSTACGGDTNSEEQTSQSPAVGTTAAASPTGAPSSGASALPSATPAAGSTAAASPSTTPADSASASPASSPTAAVTASAAPAGTPLASTAPAENTYPENGLSKTDKVTLKMGFFEGGVGRAWMDYAIKTFTQKFPNVKIEITSSPTIEKIIMPKISAGNNDDMFDIFSNTRLTWEEFADAGKLATMDDLWDRAPYDTPGKKLRDLMSSSSYKYQRFKRQGKVYAIEYGLDVMGLFYDKAFFKKNGWNEQPKTYEEFLKLCDTIKAKNIYPMTFYRGYQWGLFKPKEFELAMENGNTKFEYNFRNFIGAQYTAPESITMWTRMYEMGQKKYFEPGSGTITHTISQMQLIQHRVAMVASGSWIQNEMKNATPAGFEWGFMAMPFVSKAGSKICVQQASEDSLLIWAGKPELNVKWAKEFVLWMQNLDVQTEIVKSGMMSVRTDFSKSPARVAKLQGVCKSITEILATGNIISVDILTREVVMNDPNGYGDEAWKLADEARVAVALGKKDPLPMLKEAEALLEKAVATGVKK